jgi:predicted RNA-binding Zn-ribbon protein involved in translation (DUF1610 family)
MNEKYPHQKGWEEYRRRRNRQYIVAIAGMLVPGLSFFAFLKGGMERGPATVLLGFLSAVAVIVILAVMYHFHKWTCPACGERFFVRSFWIRFPEVLPNCTNCNLRKYAGSNFEQN